MFHVALHHIHNMLERANSHHFPPIHLWYTNALFSHQMIICYVIEWLDVCSIILMSRINYWFDDLWLMFVIPSFLIKWLWLYNCIMDVCLFNHMDELRSTFDQTIPSIVAFEWSTRIWNSHCNWYVQGLLQLNPSIDLFLFNSVCFARSSMWYN